MEQLKHDAHHTQKEATKSNNKNSKLQKKLGYNKSMHITSLGGVLHIFWLKLVAFLVHWSRCLREGLLNGCVECNICSRILAAARFSAGFQTLDKFFWQHYVVLKSYWEKRLCPFLSICKCELCAQSPYCDVVCQMQSYSAVCTFSFVS